MNNIIFDGKDTINYRMGARNVKKNYLEVPYWNGVKHKVTNGGISRFLICNCFKPPITTSQLFHSRRESIFLD